MESDASHLRNLIERARLYEKKMSLFRFSYSESEREELVKAADEAEAFLNKET